MIDLHTHTIYSDGVLSVKELIDNAILNGVYAMSITDHDSIIGIEEYYKKYLNDNIIVIPGVEISTDTYYLGRKTKIHLLGYGFKVNDENISEVLRNLHQRRYNDNKSYIEQLIPKFKFLSNEHFINFEYGKSGWLYKHILNYTCQYLSKNQLEELRIHLINNRPNYNKYNENIEDMIRLLHKCNGYAVFAHPQKCDLTKEELKILVRYLTDIGLDGLETYHIDSISDERKIIHDIAIEYGLYETGGSDFHSFKYGTGVGDANIRFPDNYEPHFVKRLVKEKKVLCGKNE